MKRVIASLIALFLVADAAGPAWAAVVRVNVSVKTVMPGFTAGASMFGVAPRAGRGLTGSNLAPGSLTPSLTRVGVLRLRLSPGILSVGPADIGLAQAPMNVAVSVAPTAAGAAAGRVRKADPIRVPQSAARGASAPLKSRRTIVKRLGRLIRASRRDRKSVSAAAGGSLRRIGREGFARLLGKSVTSSHGAVRARAGNIMGRGLKSVALPEHADALGAETPLPPRDELDLGTRRTLRRYLLGTGLYKMGMEALSLSIPLLALTVFGQAKVAAILMVGWGLAQVVFSSMAGGILDRRSPSKVMAWSMGLQAATVAVLLGLFALDSFSPMFAGFPLVNIYSLLTLYSLAGGLLGISDVAKQVIPPDIIGTKERALKIFDAKTHVAYEIAGVAGALFAGLIILRFGLITAMMIHPPFYLLAAFVFWRLGLPARSRAAVAGTAAAGKAGEPFRRGKTAISRALRDLMIGAKAVFAKKIFRWSALALIIPLITHRLLESMLIPITAKFLLGRPETAAWIIGASNAGELMGALVLLWALLYSKGKGGKRFRSAFWVRLMALGSMGILALSFTQNLWVIVPLIAFRSMTWATSELSLRGKLQNAFPEQLRGRAFAFIGAIAFLAILAASLGIGTLMDVVPRLLVFYGVDIVLGVLAILMAAAAYHLGKDKKLK